MKYKEGQIVWVEWKALNGNYIGPARITEMTEYHCWVTIPIKTFGEGDFLVLNRNIKHLIEGEENDKEEESCSKGEENKENA